MEPIVSRTPRSGTAGAVLAVAVLQVVAVAVTAVAWVWNAVFAGEQCYPDCDWTAAEVARWSYVVVVATSFAATAAAAFGARRTARDLSWVPAIGAVAIVAAFFAALAVYQGAMS